MTFAGIILLTTLMLAGTFAIVQGTADALMHDKSGTVLIWAGLTLWACVVYFLTW